MKILRTFLFICIANTATADVALGIQNHDVQIRFMHAPCATVVEGIDSPKPGMVGIGEMAMSFGFLMGFEVENPGIRGNYETVLMRLRETCELQPEKTALELLRGFAAE